MPISIVVGGQFGSEGKGKVAYHFTRNDDTVTAVVRCGGPNSGHTIFDDFGTKHVFQQLPTATILPNIKLVISAGSYINLKILFKEINKYNINNDRLFIDKNAVIITPKLLDLEKTNGLIKKISSTGSGTGAAVSSRINRESDTIFAKHIPKLAKYICNTKKILMWELSHNARIIIEGSQGFGLSPLHTNFYPFVTSRDTTAAAFLSETGLSPIDVDQIIMVLRAFPIRVAGNSGPLPNEISWDDVSALTNTDIKEYTTVTKHIRRVALFDSEIVTNSIISNSPTSIIINHVDYIHTNYNNAKVSAFINTIENNINKSINYIGFGPNILIKRNEVIK